MIEQIRTPRVTEVKFMIPETEEEITDMNQFRKSTRLRGPAYCAKNCDH